MRHIAFYVKHLAMYDNWVRPLVPFLRDAGVEPIVLHCSRLNRETASAGDRTEPDCRCIDLSELSFGEIERDLVGLEPAGVVFFTYRSLVDLLLIRCASRNGLRSIYLQHGFHVSSRFTAVDRRASVARYSRFLRWYLAFVARLPRRDALAELRTAWRAMRETDYRDCGVDRGLFYGPAGAEDAERVFALAASNVSFSGYPLVKTENELDEVRRTDGPGDGSVLYVHQPLVLDGLARISREEEAEYLRALADRCRAAGRRLTLRIHPRESTERYRAMVGEDVGVLSSGEPMACALERADVVIGHFSTALFGAVFLGKTVVLLDFPQLAGELQRLFRPIAVHAQTLDDLVGILDGSREPPVSRREFIARHIGDHNSFEHQARVLLSLLDPSAAAADRGVS